MLGMMCRPPEESEVDRYKMVEVFKYLGSLVISFTMY